jgi:membrane associated rhomboid family serine protease
MGIQSRDYYRKANSGAWADWGLYAMPRVVKWIIIINAVVFVAQMYTREAPRASLDSIRKYNPGLDKYLRENANDPEKIEADKDKHPQLKRMLEQDEFDQLLRPTEPVSVVQEWFELDSRKVVYKGQIWRLLTHAFCHARTDIFHIIFNMLFLYWFGCTLESMYGSREFLLFYLTAAVVAALAFVGLELWTGSNTPGIGASGAVMAVTMLYAMHFPRETIYVFWLVRIEMRWLMLFFVIYDLHPVLLALGGEHFFDGVAHAAHLGGLAFGFLYAKSDWRLESLLDRLPAVRKPRWGRPRLRIARESMPDERSDPDLERLDELLDKIARNGQESLSDEEREVLRRASERIKRVRGRRT